MPKLNCSGLLLKNYRHAVRIMKITAFILLAFCLQVAAKSRAQGNITLKEKGASIIKVMTEVQRQTGYDFLVTSETINRAKPVDIEVKDAPLSQVLEIVFKNQPLTYTIKDKLITIRLKAENKVSSSQNISLTGDPVTVSGRVTDENGQPLAGANVKVKGSNAGVTTDNQGRFTLNNVDPNATLEISFVGHETQLLSVKGKTVFTVALGQKVGTLDETVVIAYGTTTKRLNTGNVASVKASDIEKQPVNNPLLALQGRVPGMEITQANGVPGSGITVRIRGQNSINNGNLPLYVIDGVPYTSELLSGLGSILGSSGGGDGSRYGNPLSYINPADIESIDILKDADATAIYGSRGANGVVLISTKKGKVGETKVNVNMQQGWSKITRKLDLLNTQKYLQMRYEGIVNDGLTIQPEDYDLTLWDTTRYTDWQKELIGGSAKYTDVQASVAGGNLITQYLLSAGYHKENTVFPGSFNDQKGSFHFNLNSSSANKRFKVSLSSNFTIGNNQLPRYDLTSFATTLAPVAPSLYDDEGKLNWAPNSSGTGTWENPLNYLVAKFKNRTSNLVANAILSYELLQGLEVKSNFGITNLQADETTTFPSLYYDPSRWSSLGQFLRTSNFAYNNIRSWIIEPQITYSGQLGKGQINILIGTTVQQQNNNGQILNANGFNSDLVLEDIKAAPNVSVAGNNSSVYKYNALFGRINYNLKDKYLINLTARKDGSSRFGPENQFHHFGAAALGWIFSNEKFVEEYIRFLSFGKVRLSYGTTGSDQVGEYSYMDLYSSINAGVPYQGYVGMQTNNLYNPELAWEETRKLEAGLELSFLKNRISLTTSFYSHRSSNQLTNYSLPSVTGYSSIRRNLDALVQNTGWEFTLNSVNINTKSIYWTSTFNLTVNRNRLLSVDSGMSASFKRLAGYSLGTQFVYKYIGVDEVTGIYQFDDGNGQLTSRPDTAALISQRPISLFTKFYGGFSNSITYKGFQLDFLLQFAKQIANNYRFGVVPGSLGYNQPISVLNRWQKAGDLTTIQRYNSNYSLYQPFDNVRQSDAAYSDASFVRLKNVSLSWQLSEKWRKKAHIPNCRIYIHGQNLLTITDFEGMDPETKSTGNLPPLRVITMGLHLTL